MILKQEKGRIFGCRACDKNVRWTFLSKAAVVLTVTGIAAGILFVTDNNRLLPQNDKGEVIVERNQQGGGKREEELLVRIGETEEKITVEVEEEQFSREEIQKEFEKAQAELETLILGENTSLDEVRSSLDLITKLPGNGIAVTWELDNYKVMNLQGQLNPEALTENGTLVKMDAYLTYREEKAQYTFYAKLFPPKRSVSEQWIQKLNTELEKRDAETKEDHEMPLPSEVDGMPVMWRYVTDHRAAGLLLFGIALSLSLYASDSRKKKEREEKRMTQMELDYPQVVNRFTLYLGAGMPVRKVWFKLAEDYQNREKEKEERAVYEEMIYTMHEIQSGASENECYEKFGERCGLAVYRKFGTLLSQNLKKGTKGLADLLKQEAANTFEERKSLARKLGEEAGTKLLLPMFLMFGMVLAMIVIPAFFSMQM